MKANSDKSKQSNKATRRVLAGVLCGASVLSLVLSLVMPPISQAIANDAQTVSAEEAGADENALGEDAGAGNSTGKDAENQNSDDVEGGETNPTNDVEQNQAEDQLEDEQRGEDGKSSDDNAVMAAAEGGQTETASDKIDSAEKLKSGLEAASGTANFELVNDIDISKSILLDEDGSNITLDLNGHKIKYSNINQPLFNITKGATLTVKDNKQDAMDIPTGDDFVCQDNSLSKNGNPASMTCDNSNIPTNLTYYVTGSSVKADGTSTTETLYKHETSIGGAIVACADKDNLNLDYLKLINLYATDSKGGTFNLESGVITQQKNISVNSLVYAEEGSTVNMSGGYVCGATSKSQGAGIELGAKNNSGATLNLTGGVIAGNYAPDGGGVNAYGSTINMTGGTGGTTGGTISGNGTFENSPGFGAGICAQNSHVTVSDGYVTNNNCRFDYIKQQGMENKHKGNGCHGGGGIAAFNGGSLTIKGGYITGNYSAEAGGGIYAGAWGQALSSFTFSGGTIASNVAQNSEGGGIRIAAPTTGKFNVPLGTKAYITNNTTNTSNDWGGGGVFVQGCGDNVQSASLEIYNALITNNHANGFGGGFAACPTGKTAITDTNGIAIFGNSDGNTDGGYNRSGGTHGKNDDADVSNDGKGEITEDFKNAGHKDLFLIRDRTNSEYIAAVTGQMLGGGAANWTGTIDGQPTTISKYDGAQAKYMIGLKANPSEYDQGQAVSNARLFITDNTSNVHGGGIMTNGNVVAGSTQEVKVHHEIKLSGTKALTGLSLTKGEFSFQLLKPNESGKGPYFDKDDKLHFNDCPEVCNPVTNDASGDFVFDLGGVNSTGTNVYYLVEDPDYNHVDGVDYDKTIYRIELTTGIETRSVLGINYIDYSVTNVTVTKLENKQWKTITPSYGSDGSIKITDGNTGNTFTNAYVQGSWTPQMTKKVDGGEMKAFTFELANADDVNFTKPERATINPDSANVKTDKNGNATSTVNFMPRYYKLTDLKNGSKTFTYYVCEKDDSSTYSHYKFDKSVYKLNVTMAVQKDGRIVASKVTYTKIKDRDGNEVTNDTDHDLTDTSILTFTNTYSTSLPLSGMSGVTLTYLAGAAVLCAAAAWMHIRRKANAKGGKRRE